MGKGIWASVWRFIKRFGALLAAAVGLLLLVARCAADMVGRSTFIEDLESLLQKLRPVTEFFFRQPEWAFYPLCLFLLACGFTSVWSNVALRLAAASAARNAPPVVPDGAARGTAPAWATRGNLWCPDMSLNEVAKYVAGESTWSKEGGRSVGALRGAIQTKLYNGQVTAWGRAHPEAEAEAQVKADAWNGANLNIDTDYAFLPVYRAALHRIRLARGEVEAAWPRKA